MLTTRYKLPPLAGDDVAMAMERDMLHRWGFLSQPNPQTKSHNSISSNDSTLTNISPVTSSTSNDDDDDDDDDKGNNVDEGEIRIHSKIDDKNRENAKEQDAKNIEGGQVYTSDGNEGTRNGIGSLHPQDRDKTCHCLVDKTEDSPRYEQSLHNILRDSKDLKSVTTQIGHEETDIGTPCGHCGFSNEKAGDIDTACGPCGFSNENAGDIGTAYDPCGVSNENAGDIGTACDPCGSSHEKAGDIDTACDPCGFSNEKAGDIGTACDPCGSSHEKARGNDRARKVEYVRDSEAKGETILSGDENSGALCDTQPSDQSKKFVKANEKETMTSLTTEGCQLSIPFCDSQPSDQSEKYDSDKGKENLMSLSSEEIGICVVENSKESVEHRHPDEREHDVSTNVPTKVIPESEKSIEEGAESRRKMSGPILDLYEEACHQYENQEFCECLLSVEEALDICSSAKDNIDDVQLWLLRSKVMNSMEDHKEALRSAYKVKPSERPTRLWVEGAIAMERLGVWVTAEMWIAMAIHLCIEEYEKGRCRSEAGGDGANEIKGVLELMQSRLRVERIFGPLVKDKPIRVLASVKYNRIIRATRKIKKGEVIFHDLPEVLEQSIKSHTITACAGCAKSLVQPEDLFEKDTVHKLNADTKKSLKKLWLKRNVTSCSFCSEVKYCSEKCRKSSWDSHHKVVCPSTRESTAAMLYDVRRSFRDVIAADGSSWQGWWNVEFSPTLLSRMIAMVLCNANRLADLRTKESYTDNHWSMCEAVLEKYSPCDKIHATDNIPKMQELVNSLFKRSKFLRYDLTITDFNKRYSQASTNAIRFHDITHPMNNFADQIKRDNKLFKKLGKSHGTLLEKSSIAEFHGLFPLACCLNHSCFPNAEIGSAEIEGRPGIVVKAVRDIKANEEVVISYVEPLDERHERRGKLWRKYKLVCDCPRCLHEGIGPHVCTNCAKKAKPKEFTKVTDESIVEKKEGYNGDLPPHNACKDAIEVSDELKESMIDLATSSSPDDAPSMNYNDKNAKLSDANSLHEQEKAPPAEKRDTTESDSKPQNEQQQKQQTERRVVTLRPTMNFAACGRCKRAWYCSTDCQKESWTRGHKKICVAR